MVTLPNQIRQSRAAMHKVYDYVPTKHAARIWLKRDRFYYNSSPCDISTPDCNMATFMLFLMPFNFKELPIMVTLPCHFS